MPISLDVKYVSVTLAIQALITGLTAAYYWYKSTTVEPDPGPAGLSGQAEIQQSGWTAAIMRADTEVARFNKIASLWTALSVAVGAASSIFGAFSR